MNERWILRPPLLMFRVKLHFPNCSLIFLISQIDRFYSLILA